MTIHGFTPPVPDGKQLTAEDCPSCGLPTLIGEHYGMPYGPVRLDAMPVVVWEQVPHTGEHVQRRGGHDGTPLYVEHVCPVRL